MPEGVKSEATIRAEMLAERMVAQYEALVESGWTDPPLLTERVSPGEFRRRWRAMTPEERMAEIERQGQGDRSAGMRSVMEALGVV